MRRRDSYTKAMIDMSFSAGASVGDDGFKPWNNAGYTVTIGTNAGDDSYALIGGDINNNAPGAGSTLCLGLDCQISANQDLATDITFGTNGLFVVTESAYANLDSAAWVDPVFTPVNPDDVLVGSPFEGDPNTPLFTAAQLAEFQSFDINISDIPCRQRPLPRSHRRDLCWPLVSFYLPQSCTEVLAARISRPKLRSGEPLAS